MPKQHDNLLIAPSLFDYVIETADALTAGRANIDDEVRGNDRLVLFLENFVAQFAAKVLDVRLPGLTVAAFEEWVAQRHLLASRPNTEDAQRLMFALEQVFNLIGELGYGGEAEALTSFRVEYVPEVLERIVDWAADWPGLSTEVTQAASEAFRRYSKAVGI